MFLAGGPLVFTGEGGGKTFGTEVPYKKTFLQTIKPGAGVKLTSHAVSICQVSGVLNKTPGRLALDT